MNWFTMLKLAVLMEKKLPEYYTYTDIGHCKFDGTRCPQQLEIEEMWFIDDVYQLHTQPTAENDTHSNSFPEFFSAIAHGRYTKDERFPNGTIIVEITSANNLFINNPRKLEFIKKKVIQILENNYGPQTQIYSDTR